MKVGIDISNLHEFSKKRGIGFYTRYLIDSLKKYTSVEAVVLESKNDELDQIDLIHYPYFDLFSPTLPFFKNFPTVVTVHDVTPLVFPKHYPPGIKGRINHIRQRASLLNTGAIITDSEASKKDIIKYFKISSDKVNVVYLAQADHFKVIKDEKVLEKLRGRYKLPEQFALYAGSVNWNKNLINLTAGCLDAGIDLVVVGRDFENRENLNHKELESYKKFLQKYSNNPNVHISGFVEDEDLVGLMNLARVIMLPSFYEGFGLTILEGQACGTPVITSSVSSMPEVGGEGALYVNPYNMEDITQAIKKVLQDENLQKKLIERGFNNLKRFSWQRAAEETALVYEKICRRA